MTQPARLYTFAISHYSEKIRWTLDTVGVPYEEVAWTPFLHVPQALLKTRGKTTVPILEADGEVVQDSTDILHWLERHRAPFALVPASPALRAEAYEIEERFDRVGRHVLRVAYASILEHRDVVLDSWSVGSSPLTKAFLSASYGVLEPALRRRFGVIDANIPKSRERIHEALTWLEERLADGRPYLLGERLSIADVTAASLLAPLACPAEHPLYGSPRVVAAMRRGTEGFAGRPGIAWVRALYAAERRRQVT